MSKYINQQDEYGCAPVAVANVLAYFGMIYDLEDLYEECGTDEHGTDTKKMVWCLLDKLNGGFSVEVYDFMDIQEFISIVDDPNQCIIMGGIDPDINSNDMHYCTILQRDLDGILIANFDIYEKVTALGLVDLFAYMKSDLDRSDECMEYIVVKRKV